MSAIYLHPVQTPAELLLRDCEVRHERRRGPGGQHRNKTESAVVIKHLPTGVSAQAAERRSQHDNHRMAVKRLRINLALEVRSPELANAAPTELWHSRRHEEKFACNVDHEHFAPLLAEALDVVFDHQGQTPGSALQLGITASQLVKFLKQEPRAFLLVNDWRRQHGLRTLE
ncbi:MAG: Class peptide chain release factor [Schlesneria sp.]|nr:Class peptide chain release factor [Schlesneria sp.]